MNFTGTLVFAASCLILLVTYAAIHWIGDLTTQAKTRHGRRYLAYAASAVIIIAIGLYVQWISAGPLGHTLQLAWLPVVLSLVYLGMLVIDIVQSMRHTWWQYRTPKRRRPHGQHVQTDTAQVPACLGVDPGPKVLLRYWPGELDVDIVDVD